MSKDPLDYPAAFAGMVQKIRERAGGAAPAPTPVRAVPEQFRAFTDAFPRHTRRKIEAMCRKAKRLGKTVRIYGDGRCEIVPKPTSNVLHVAKGLGSVPGSDEP